ncbi:type II toxin-antitoxin system Phd/YefM family antitoxin [Saccharopolyspora shandongensis]|uniref:type II toxin-antitoxin system Phd/YefM family antitoxin n=1 Tax=Saccharopolyspora shandongensis TaxID=418495 RepID=UPI00343BE63A
MSVEAVHMDDSAAIEVNVSSARAQLPSYIELASEGQYVYLTHRGKRVAALVAADVAEHWEAEEDAHWARRVAEAEESGTVSWEAAIVALERDR